MDRGALKVAAAKQKLQAPVEPGSLERELALRRLVLEFELEVKKVERQKECDLEAKKLESERMKLEMQKESEKLEYERRARQAEI